MHDIHLFRINPVHRKYFFVELQYHMGKAAGMLNACTTSNFSCWQIAFMVPNNAKLGPLSFLTGIWSVH